MQRDGTLVAEAARALTVDETVSNAAVFLFGGILGTLLAGAILTETIFSWPGIGRLLVTAVANRDLAVVQCVLLLVAATALPCFQAQRVLQHPVLCCAVCAV
mgnify:CR=1 FL=1